MEQLRAWGTRQNGGSERPLYSRLPKQGYQDNPVANALTAWVDGKYISVKQQLEQFYRELSPETCKAEYLDYLAALVALADDYWQPQWSESVKRQMIANVSRLLKRRGTYEAVRTVLAIHDIDYRLWASTALLMPFAMPRSFGSDDLRYYLRLPLKYARLGAEFKEAQRTLRNWSAAFVRSAVCYEYFYCGYSILGDPMFSLPPAPAMAGVLPDVNFSHRQLVPVNVQDLSTAYTVTMPNKPSDSMGFEYRVQQTTANGGTVALTGNTVLYRPADGFQGVDSAKYWLVGDRRQAANLTFEVARPVLRFRFVGQPASSMMPTFNPFNLPIYSTEFTRFNESYATANRTGARLTFRGNTPSYNLHVKCSHRVNSTSIRILLGADRLENQQKRVIIFINPSSIDCRVVDGASDTRVGILSGLSFPLLAAGGIGSFQPIDVEVRGSVVSVMVDSTTATFVVPDLTNRPYVHGVTAGSSADFYLHELRYSEL